MTVMSAATPVSVERDRHLQRRNEFEAGFDRYGRSLYRYFAVRTGGDVHAAKAREVEECPRTIIRIVARG